MSIHDVSGVVGWCLVAQTKGKPSHHIHTFIHTATISKTLYTGEGYGTVPLAFLTSVPARKTSLPYKGKNLHLIQCNSI